MKHTVSGIILFIVTFAAVQVMADRSDEVLTASGVKGGLIVVVGCDDPELVTGLCRDAYVVHALDADAKKVSGMRDHIKAKGLYGKASAVAWNGDALPYVDNLVNLLIDESGKGKVASEEILRVLAPGGVSLVKGKKSTKPVPDSIDEWRHYLHDADNNAVANDTVVGPPRHMQWRAGPDWIRSHHMLASISAVVTAKGRIFSVIDTATAGPSKIAARWRVVARDAFNGVKLWERDIESWTNVKRGFRSGPVQVPRLLVTDGDRVFLPLGNNKPITALDAATGEIAASYKGTENAEEILLTDSKLIVYRGEKFSAHSVTAASEIRTFTPDSTENTPQPKEASIVVVDLKNGKVIWSRDVAGDKAPIAQTIASDGKRVYYESPLGVTALDMAKGKELWTFPVERKKYDKSGMGSVLVVSDDVVLSHLGGLHAVSAIDGKLLWKAAGKGGFRSPPDLFVIDGQVWYGSGFGSSFDLKTGAKTNDGFTTDKVKTVGHHHRCYRSKASVNFLMGGYRGIELYDLHGEDHSRNNWIRGLCQYGILPANGLIYAPGHSCSCYMESMLFGFYALAPASARRQTTDHAKGVASNGPRLAKGPAKIKNGKLETGASAWPTFRGDSMRRGISESKVTNGMTPAWSVQVGTRVTSPVVADGVVIVSDIDTHTIHALSEKDGKELWTFTTDGRVDSPPTLAGSAVVFGSMDGNVYCVSLKKGELAWRFRAAPSTLNAMAREQLESVWPVHGAILVKDGIAYFTAGRNSFIDGGLYLYALDVETGKLMASNHYVTGHGTAHPKGGPTVGRHSQNSWDIKTAEHPDKSDSFSMGGCKNDIMSTDGTSVFLHQLRFNTKLENQERKTRHIFSTSNFADGNENHRSHWFIGYGDFTQLAVAYEWMTGGRNYGALRAIKGIMIAYDENAAWVVDRGRGYELRRHKNIPFDPDEEQQRDFGRRNKKKKTKKGAKPVREVTSDTEPNALTLSEPEWTVGLKIRPRTIVKAGDILVVGGMPAETNKAFPYELVEGRRAGLIQMFSSVDGKLAGEIKLPTAVIWDGIAPANNKLFVSTVDGKLTCIE